MKLGAYLGEKSLLVVVSFLSASACALLLYAFNANLYFALFAPSLFIIGVLFALAVDFVRKKSYYDELQKLLEQLDQKRLLLEVIEKPEFLEGKIWNDVLRAVTKSMNDAVAKSEQDVNAYREYIELWVHEIKTPIAAALLIGENARNETALDELVKIEFYVEQALYYARSSAAEQDYLIKPVDLGELVSGVLKNNARFLVAHKITVRMDGLSLSVFTDAKWVAFILRQLIDNSVKYGCRTLSFSGRAGENSVSLFVRDDGAGIPEQDVGRVFDKGFTGENGRRFGRSTGLGLYLCQKLCHKLGLDIAASSQSGEGTVMEIIFPKKEMFG
jgi:signal transduction histidine kinase